LVVCSPSGPSRQGWRRWPARAHHRSRSRPRLWRRHWRCTLGRWRSRSVVANRGMAVLVL
jgi:hypothetical protein